MINSYDAAHP